MAGTERAAGGGAGRGKEMAAGTGAGTRWAVLSVLFAVRMTMAFQFESVAAVAPTIMRESGAGLADVALLFSLYLAPGVVIALPGGELGRRLGDSRGVTAGLVLMIAGGIVTALASAWAWPSSWCWQLAGRVVAGTGGVVLNVVLSKMVADWFADGEIATAMGVFVASWPVGIALALLTLPPVAAVSGSAGAGLAAASLAALAILLVGAGCRAPPVQSRAGPAAAWPASAAVPAVLAAGCIWGLYNAALGTVFGFGTALLAERGWTPTGGGAAVSLVLWLVSVSVPAGGMLADRGRRHAAVMAWGFVLLAAAVAVAARTDHVVLVFAALGVVGGLPAGPVMSLPARVLAPAARATGMGIFYTVYYAIVVAGPIVAGRTAAAAGSSRAAFDAGVVMLLGCVAAHAVFTGTMRTKP